MIYFYAQLNPEENNVLIATLPDNSEKILTFNQHDFNDEQCVTILEKLDSDKNTSRIKLCSDEPNRFALRQSHFLSN